MLISLPIVNDEQINGLSVCVNIIRTKYFDFELPNSVLLSLDWEEFESLIQELYKKLRYSTELTPKHDHGKDIMATKNSVGKKEKLLI